jgi:hypothetical protein
MGDFGDKLVGWVALFIAGFLLGMQIYGGL